MEEGRRREGRGEDDGVGEGDGGVSKHPENPH